MQEQNIQYDLGAYALFNDVYQHARCVLSVRDDCHLDLKMAQYRLNRLKHNQPLYAGHNGKMLHDKLYDLTHKMDIDYSKGPCRETIEDYEFLIDLMSRLKVTELTLVGSKTCPEEFVGIPMSAHEIFKAYYREEYLKQYNDQQSAKSL